MDKNPVHTVPGFFIFIMMQTKNLLLVFTASLFIFSCQVDEPVQLSGVYERPLLTDMVMYEINLRAFSDPPGFSGIEDRLDELAEIGVNTLWLMPIFPVGQENSVGQLGSPYAVANYTEVNPEFGDMESFQSLVDAAHDRGMAVILDWVANHTAWDNPWIAQTDWYTQDPSGNIVIPPGTNWNDVADLNFDNAEMRLAMIDAMRFWVAETGIDGFRCDAADMVPFSFWQQALDSLHTAFGTDLIMLAEGARVDHFAAGFDLNYGWSFYGAIKNVLVNNYDINSLYTTHLAETSLLNPGTFKLRFTTNHDESAWDAPPAELFGSQEAAVAASVITIFMGGVPLLYNGQEVGLDQNLPFFSADPIDWSAHPEVLDTYQRLIGLFNEHTALRYGTLTWLDSGYHTATFLRSYGGEEWLFIVNPKSVSINYTLPAEVAASGWEDMWNGGFSNPEASTTLPAASFRIYRRML